MRDAVRATFMAMQVVPQDTLPNLTALAQLPALLDENSKSIAVIEMTGQSPQFPHLLALHDLLLFAHVRQRVVLVRTGRGVWQTDRAWATKLGFADLLGSLDTTGLLAESRPFVELAARLTGAEPLRKEALSRYFSGMQVKSDTVSMRGLIRSTTGVSAEDLCAALACNVKALDRSYLLKSYPRCFLGTQAVKWLGSHLGVSSAKAIELGRALQSLGMLHHVVHEHAFDDVPFFYRTGLSTAADQQDLGAIYRKLKASDGVEVTDRDHHGTVYPSCFVGSEAVDWVVEVRRLSRHDAEIVLNRLHGFGLIEHVLGHHPVRDGKFFYRFVD